MTINFFTQLPAWPSDALDQQIWFNQMKVLLTNLDTQINNALVVTITLSQSTLPSQSDWETAWTGEGHSLPIPPSARLLWYDTSNGRFGGVFGTLNNDTNVYARGSANSPGATSVVETASMPLDSHSVNYNLGDDTSNHPSLTVVANVAMKLYLTYTVPTTLSSGSGSWGADFLINGIKAGTLYYSLASNRGIVERTTTGQLIASLVTPTLNPDTYEIQAILGRTNATTPTVSLASGIRALFVRGVVQS